MLKGDTGKSNIDCFAIDRLAGKTESVTMSGVAVPVKNSPCFFKSIIFKPVTGFFYKIGRGLSPSVLSLNFVGFFGKSTAAAKDADFDGDNLVGGSDFAIFVQRFGTPPGPSGLACAGTIPCTP